MKVLFEVEGGLRPEGTESYRMTLILSLLSHDWCLQVADRRTVRTDSGAVVEDDFNKVVLWGGRAVFGFTGVTSIDGVGTTEWLMGKLVGHSRSSSAIENVRQAASQAFAHPPQKSTFLQFVAFYFRDLGGPNQPSQAQIISISNARGPIGRGVTDEFYVEKRDLEPADDLFLHSAGQHLPDHLQVRLLRDLRTCLERAAGPATMARLLAETVWAVAAQNHVVGRRLLVSMLPRTCKGPKEEVDEDGRSWLCVPTGYWHAAARTVTEFFHLPENAFGDQPIFLYVNPDGDNLVAYMPDVVLRGTIFSGGLARRQPRG